MTDKLRLKPHLYNQMIGQLMDAVVTYGQTQQLRTHLAKVVDQYIEPDHPHTRPAPQFYQATWSWRSWEVNAVITSEDYELLKSRPDVEVVMRDFRGYGNDEEFTFSDLSFTPIDAGMASNFAVMCCSVNEEVLTDLLSAVKSKIEIEGVS